MCIRDSSATFWMTKAEQLWDLMGMPAHHGKSVDCGQGGFQGTEVHPTQHLVGRDSSAAA
eukprot:7426773-Pyramimonas_sp.AAC.1